MGKYTEIKSNFIKEKIKKTKWKDSDYIDDLLKIEYYVLGGESGRFTPYLVERLEKDHPKEFKAIRLELDPSYRARRSKEEDREKAKEKREQARMEREWQKEDERDRKDWIKAGGKI
jgi:hypothetical protein